MKELLLIPPVILALALLGGIVAIFLEAIREDGDARAFMLAIGLPLFILLSVFCLVVYFN